MDDYCGVRTEALQNNEGSTIFRLLFSIFVQRDMIVMWLKDFRHFSVDWNDVRNGILTKMNRS